MNATRVLTPSEVVTTRLPVLGPADCGWNRTRMVQLPPDMSWGVTSQSPPERAKLGGEPPPSKVTV